MLAKYAEMLAKAREEKLRELTESDEDDDNEEGDEEGAANTGT